MRYDNIFYHHNYCYISAVVKPEPINEERIHLSPNNIADTTERLASHTEMHICDDTGLHYKESIENNNSHDALGLSATHDMPAAIGEETGYPVTHTSYLPVAPSKPPSAMPYVASTTSRRNRYTFMRKRYTHPVRHPSVSGIGVRNTPTPMRRARKFVKNVYPKENENSGMAVARPEEENQIKGKVFAPPNEERALQWEKHESSDIEDDDLIVVKTEIIDEVPGSLDNAVLQDRMATPQGTVNTNASQGTSEIKNFQILSPDYASALQRLAETASTLDMVDGNFRSNEGGVGMEVDMSSVPSMLARRTGIETEGCINEVAALEEGEERPHYSGPPRIRAKRTKDPIGGKQVPAHCKYCGKVFKYRHNMEEHMRIHTGEKPFSCNICGKQFRHQSTVLAHIKIHTGEKVGCKICGKEFSRMSTLKEHERGHTGERLPLTCRICGLGFKRLTCLQVHEKKHAVLQ